MDGMSVSALIERGWRRVDHGLYPGQRLRQSLAGNDVDADGTGVRDDVLLP